MSEIIKERKLCFIYDLRMCFMIKFAMPYAGFASDANEVLFENDVMQLTAFLTPNLSTLTKMAASHR